MSAAECQPSGPSLLRLLPIMLRRRRDPLLMLEECWRRYGDIVRLPAPGPRPSYLLVHPDHVRQVLQDNHRNYQKARFYTQKLELVLGAGLLTVEGERWQQRRRLDQLAFRGDRLARLGPITTELTVRMLQQWARHSEMGQDIDILQEFTRLALTVVGRTLFGADLTDDSQAIARAVFITQKHGDRRLKLYVDVPDWFPLPSHHRHLAAVRQLKALGQRLIAERVAAPEQPDDLLSLLLADPEAPTDRPTAERDVRDEILTMLIGGHETTALALTWACDLLTRHPEAERHLQAELAATLDGREPTVEDLPRLPYTRMILLETMRLYPPLWSLTRSPLADDEIGGCRIPSGSTLFLVPYLTHRHPAFWHEPERFDPERFAPKRVAERPPFAYFPFGGGPRTCIGTQFALTEAQLVLATVAQRFRLRPGSVRRAAPRPMVTLRPSRPILLHPQPVRPADARSQTPVYVVSEACPAGSAQAT